MPAPGRLRADRIILVSASIRTLIHRDDQEYSPSSCLQTECTCEGWSEIVRRLIIDKALVEILVKKGLNIMAFYAVQMHIFAIQCVRARVSINKKVDGFHLSAVLPYSIVQWLHFSCNCTYIWYICPSHCLHTCESCKFNHFFHEITGHMVL